MLKFNDREGTYFNMGVYNNPVKTKIRNGNLKLLKLSLKIHERFNVI